MNVIGMNLVGMRRVLCPCPHNVFEMYQTRTPPLAPSVKADIRIQVRNLKTLFPDNFSGNPEDRQGMIKDVISTWVANGSYLHDVVPGSVGACLPPMSHAVIISSRLPRSTSVTPSLHQPASRFISTDGQIFQHSTVIPSMVRSQSHS